MANYKKKPSQFLAENLRLFIEVNGPYPKLGVLIDEINSASNKHPSLNLVKNITPKTLENWQNPEYPRAHNDNHLTTVVTYLLYRTELQSSQTPQINGRHVARIKSRILNEPHEAFRLHYAQQDIPSRYFIFMIQRNSSIRPQDEWQYDLHKYLVGGFELVSRPTEVKVIGKTFGASLRTTDPLISLISWYGYRVNLSDNALDFTCVVPEIYSKVEHGLPPEKGIFHFSMRKEKIGNSAAPYVGDHSYYGYFFAMGFGNSGGLYAEEVDRDMFRNIVSILDEHKLAMSLEASMASMKYTNASQSELDYVTRL